MRVVALVLDERTNPSPDKGPHRQTMESLPLQLARSSKMVRRIVHHHSNRRGKKDETKSWSPKNGNLKHPAKIVGRQIHRNGKVDEPQPDAGIDTRA